MADRSPPRDPAVDALLKELAQAAAQLSGTARALAARLGAAQAPPAQVEAVIRDLVESASAIEDRIQRLPMARQGGEPSPIGDGRDARPPSAARSRSRVTAGQEPPAKVADDRGAHPASLGG